MSLDLVHLPSLHCGSVSFGLISNTAMVTNMSRLFVYNGMWCEVYRFVHMEVSTSARRGSCVGMLICLIPLFWIHMKHVCLLLSMFILGRTSACQKRVLTEKTIPHSPKTIGMIFTFQSLLTCWSAGEGAPVLKLYYQRTKIQPAAGDGRSSIKVVLSKDENPAGPQ